MLNYLDYYGNCSTKIKITATNNCGSKVYTTSVNGTNSPPHRLSNSSIYEIYPNPSKEIVNIKTKDLDNKLEKNSKISGELFDLMGLLKLKIDDINNKPNFSVSGLKKGVYILNIYINDQTEIHQIIVD